MSARIATLALCTALAVPLAAGACGACLEDKIAATYDHAVVARAHEKGHLLVYAAVEGGGDPAALAQSVKQAAGRVPGVQRDSVRAAASPQALSFALDPRGTDPVKALGAIERGARGAKLTLLRIDR